MSTTCWRGRVVALSPKGLHRPTSSTRQGVLMRLLKVSRLPVNRDDIAEGEHIRMWLSAVVDRVHEGDKRTAVLTTLDFDIGERGLGPPCRHCHQPI
jgi:hypothetical protein